MPSVAFGSRYPGETLPYASRNVANENQERRTCPRDRSVADDLAASGCGTLSQLGEQLLEKRCVEKKWCASRLKKSLSFTSSYHHHHLSIIQHFTLENISLSFTSSYHHHHLSIITCPSRAHTITYPSSPAHHPSPNQ